MVSKIQFSRASDGPKPLLRPVQIEDKICKQLAALEAPLKKASLQERDITLIEKRYKERLAQAAAVPNSKAIRDKAKEVRKWINQARWRLKNAPFEEMIKKCEQDDKPEKIYLLLRSAEPSRIILDAAEELQEDATLSIVYKSGIESDGRYDMQGEIALNESMSFKRKAAVTLFELTNAIQRADFLALLVKAAKREITVTEYATQCEAIEYEGVKHFSETIQTLIHEHGWDPAMDLYSANLRGPWSTFNGYLLDQIVNGHFAVYRKVYADIQSPSITAQILASSH